MKRIMILGALALATTLTAAAPSYATDMTKCQMRYTMKEWSVFYKQGKGQGTVTCDNGQTADVTLEAKGGGLTAGKGEIRDGLGKFSDVADINELFGTYASANASAGAGNSAAATAMTKGEVSLALNGKGTGIEVGVSFGKFTITRK
jgi:major membrane immunogen (membrane-anchored lipoprotein)